MLAGVPEQSLASPRNPAALVHLAERARADLALLNDPVPDWMPSRADDAPLDVLVVGAGMNGQTAAFALRREGITRVRTIDAAARGEEGPWATFARMLTLRSPKHLIGPDLGVPSLTFQAWYRAQHGDAGWQALHKVGRIDWRDYLLWVRDTVGLVVENNTRLLSVAHETDAAGHTVLLAEVQTPQGRERIGCRKLVLALGRDGAGAPRWPAFESLRPGDPLVAGRVFHSADAIDFTRLAGARVGVLGAGASAFDNAACALEAGAEVWQYCRRSALPQVNKSKAASHPGFLHGFVDLPDAFKWRFYTYIFDTQVPPPWETVRRCDAFEAFHLVLGRSWRDVRPLPDGLEVTLDSGAVERFDAVIFGTGFDVDVLQRPELMAYAPAIDTWQQHVADGQAVAHPDAASYPYLSAGFALQPRAGSDPALAPALARMHLFNWGATMSQAALGSDIPGCALGATRLAQAIARDLFVQDAPQHWQALLDADEPELLHTRWHVPMARQA